MPRKSASIAAAVLLSALAVVLVVSPASAAQKPAAGKAAAAQAAPARPQPTTFGFGVMAGTDLTGIASWMPNTAPWNYAYRYIGGGLNRGGTTNWTTWSPNATFPNVYATAADAKGYIPVFSYYSMLAAIGPCAGRTPACSGEAETDLNNLNSPSVMSLYYNDFAKLMQRLGNTTVDGVPGYGKDTIVHVEPDLSGYAESAVLSSAKCFSFCTGVGNDPSLLKASVGSSGVPEVAAYPNTYRGFNQALLKLRDLYAPNVRLAFHVSNWATLYDLNSATSPTLDANALGTKAGQFAAASGTSWTDGTTSTYDLIFNDVANRDAAYYTYVQHKPRFWDRDNVVFPNFHRWEDYVRAVTTAAGVKAMVWQVPMGNQYFRTVNNTAGHWQDNKVEYIFSHVTELRDAGIVGVLFGTTIADATKNYDENLDAVTNPPAICNSDGSSSGPICNDHLSIYKDDDGGYLRTAAASYYQAPLSLLTP